MGQAKQRGTLEERIKASQAADDLLKIAYPMKMYRDAKLAAFNGDKIRCALAVMQTMIDNQKQEELTKPDRS